MRRYQNSWISVFWGKIWWHAAHLGERGEARGARQVRELPGELRRELRRGGAGRDSRGLCMNKRALERAQIPRTKAKWQMQIDCDLDCDTRDGDA